MTPPLFARYTPDIPGARGFWTTSTAPFDGAVEYTLKLLSPLRGESENKMREPKEIIHNGKTLLEWVEINKTQNANLQGADLWGADLQGADLQEADLQEANLQEANLWGANLQGANLWGANLQGANLWGARGIYVFGGIGNSNRTGYAWIENDIVIFGLGCHFGNTKETISAIREKYGTKSTYEAQIKLAEKIMLEKWGNAK